MTEEVKIWGAQIELGEIEAQLSRHPGVREAVVLAREDEPGEKRLVAYYTAVSEAEADVQGLHAHLAVSLPEHMVPAAYVRLEAMPLRPNGRLDRRALPAPEGKSKVQGGEESMETAIAQIWADVLGLARVGRHDNFFDLGGHSLKAMRVTAAIRDMLDFECPLALLFEEPTLSGLAPQLEKTRNAQREMEAGRLNGREEELRRELAQMSDDEVARLLRSMEDQFDP